MAVHSRTIVAVEWLRHECRRLAVLISSISNYVLKDLQIVGSSQESGIAKVDFALTGGCNFVVVTFNCHAAFPQCQRNLGTQIDERVGWCAGDITFFWPDSVTKI